MDERVIKALKYIEANLGTNLDLKEVARAACVSPFHFHRLFKQETGLTLKKFIEALKIDQAIKMIVRPETKIQDVAAYLGYNDAETFSRAFKRRYRISPDDLRKVLEQALNKIQSDKEPDCIVFAFKEDSPEEIALKIMQSLPKNNLANKENPLDELRAFSFEETSKENHNNKGRRAKSDFKIQECEQTALKAKSLLLKHN